MRHLSPFARLIVAGWLALAGAGRTPAAAAPAPAAPGLFSLSLKWQRCPPWYCETGWYASPAVGDIDDDGQAEVLWGGYTLMSVNGATGAIEWRRPQGSSSRL